uniref:C2H2-type domain-containing protein n=1 Tax=Dendroctonus ponderosae TaxID=77166 RepID=A0AAR5P4M6_DENPD
MEETGETAKAKTLAVFENVVTKERKKRKFKTHRFSDDDSSPSESELVIDDGRRGEAKRRCSTFRIRLKQETIHLRCCWGDCTDGFESLMDLTKHFEIHTNSSADLRCKWTDCPNPDNIPSREFLLRHLSVHGYLGKLVNVGENVLRRNNFPECSLKRSYTIEMPLAGYECEWEGCSGIIYNTVCDFLSHVECHVNGAPSGKVKGKPENIPCEWNVCNGSFSTRYKLGEHLRTHTKERMLACPTCMAQFSSKTTFSDHRKRQLKTHMRSYQCSQCLKLFSIERLLSDHMRSHINQYKCALCDMTSPNPSTLSKHYRYRHMNIRPFTCGVCSKTFVTKCNLDIHLRTHQEKAFQCDQCEFGCKSKVGLKSHMVKVHGLESLVYECQLCKRQFKRGSYLTCHLINLHEFHWPSGHCRFRYRKDSDGVHRLQTVRYESLEVTEQMIESESRQSKKSRSAATYNIVYDNDAPGDHKFIVMEEHGVEPRSALVSDEDEPASEQTRSIIITIEDVDESGNVVRSTEVDSEELFVSFQNEVAEAIKPIGCKDMPAVELK